MTREPGVHDEHRPSRTWGYDAAFGPCDPKALTRRPLLTEWDADEYSYEWATNEGDK